MKHPALPLLLLSLALAAGCTHQSEVASDDAGPVTPTDKDAGPVGPDCVADPCACCTEGQVCFEGQCCTPNCEGKACGSDGCGGTCSGQCDPGWSCNPSTGACECTPDDDPTFCTKQGVECGAASGKDNCGATRTDVTCDLCVAPKTCDRAASACVCIPEPDGDLCTAQGKDCGELQVTDRCGTTKPVQCGTCEQGSLCSATNQCVLCIPDDAPTFCAAHGKTCGSFSALDNCNEPRADINCGTCAPGTLCDGATNTCAACTSESDAAFCARVGGAQPYDCGVVSGTDNCNLPRNANCGACVAPRWCDDTNHCQACVAETDTAFCQRNNVACGAFAATDNCLAPRNVAECGPCTTGDICTSGACVLCTPESDAAFCARLNKSCGPATADDNCGIPRTVAECGACTAPKVCTTASFCGFPGAPLNDECIGAEAIALTATANGLSGTVHGNTGSAVDGEVSGCVPSYSGPDIVYKFTVPPGPNLRAQIAATTGAGSTYKPALSLRTTCAQKATELACGYSVAATRPATMTARALQPGDYFVWVDGSGSGMSGEFDLSVTLTPAPAAPSNDNCNAPTLLTVANGSVTVFGDNTYAAADYTGSCAAMNGGDLVYQLDLAADSDVTATVARLDASPDLLPAVYLRRTCASGATSNEVKCASTTTGTASFSARNLASGTYFILVDSTSLTWGSFALTVSATTPIVAPANDLCVAATPLTIDTRTNSVAVVGTTAGGVNDSTGSCGTLNGADVVYSFDLAAASRVSVTVTRDAATPNFVPAVYLRGICSSSVATDEKACAASAAATGTAVAMANDLPLGTYYVIVDGSGGTEGAFALNIQVQPSITNVSCATAQALTVDPVTHLVTVTSDTRVGSDTITSSCKTSATGKDLVFSFTVGATNQNATVIATPLAGSALKVNPSIRSNCSTVASELACATTSTSSPAILKANNLATGTYFIWIDGMASTANGPFSLTLRLEDSPAAPANDSCAAAQVVAIDSTTGIGTARGTTESALGDSDGTCRGSGSGGDVVYKFSLATPRMVDITVTPQAVSGLRPVLYVRGTCASASTESQCIGAGAAGYPAEVQYARLPAGDYYVIVDSYDAASTGAFDLAITTGAPSAPASNDLCASATPMPAFDPVTHRAAITANTLDATDTDASDCSTVANPLNGADLVYSFALPTDSKVIVRATRDAGNAMFRPAVSVRRTCSIADEAACALDSSGSSSLTAILGAGTWYVVVDGVAGSFGPFTLEVIQTTAATNPGDQCGNALPLTFANNVATATGNLNNDEAFQDYKASCAPQANVGPDTVYYFDLPAAGTVKVEMGSPAVGGGTLYPTLSLRRECSNVLTEVGCKYGNTAATYDFTTGRLSPGRYYVFADCFGKVYSGPYVLTVTFTPATTGTPANDTCAGATPVVFVNGEAHLTGDTRDASDDFNHSGACGSYTAALSGGDVVYAVTVAQGESLTASVARDSTTAGYFPAVYLRDACSSALPTDQVACYTTSSTTYGVAGLTATNLNAGTYYVIVDGQQGTTGLYKLDLYRRAAAPTNVTCTAAQALTFANVSAGVDVANVFGDTSQGASATAGITQNGQSCASAGSELYYAVTTSAVKDLRIDVTPLTIGYQPTVYVRSNCTDSASQVTCAYNTAGAVMAAKLKLPAGSYTIVVDSSSGSYNGPFQMKVTLSDPPPPPLYDTCVGAQRLTLPASGAPATRITDDTGSGNNDYTGACALSSTPFDGPDYVYTFTLTSSTQVTATVTPTSSVYKPAVYIRPTCGTVGNDVCKYSTSAGPSYPATVAASLSPGTYYLIVDGVAGTFGGYTLDVSTNDSKVLEGDHCLNAISLDPLFQPATDVGVTATVTGNTALAWSDTDGSCASGSGGDFFYSFTVAVDSVVEVSVQPDTTGGASTYASNVYVRRTCTDTTTQLFCVGTSANNSPKGGRILRVTPGTYYMVVDAYTSAAGKNGPFSATLKMYPVPPPAANDTCTGATPLSIGSATTLESVTVAAQETAFSIDQYSGSCAPSIGPDLVYTFTTTAARSFSATAAPVASPSSKAVLYLRTVCNQSASVTEAACGRTTSSGGTATIALTTLPPGTYYLVLDNDFTTTSDLAGKYDLTVRLDAPTTGPANDACMGAQTITLTGGVGSTTSVSGTTIGANASSVPECGSGTSAPDVVYSFSLTSAAKVSAKLMPVGYAPDVYIRSDCGGSASAHSLACAYTPTTGQAVTATTGTLHPGTYYVWVGGGTSTTSAWTGAFTLEITLSAPAGTPPANDTCDGVVPLTFNVPATGDTTNATNDYDWGWSNKSGCQPQSYAYSGWGNDVVYSYTPSADGAFKVTVSSTNSCDPELWVGAGGVCGDPRTCVVGKQAGGTSETVTVTGVAGTTYWIYAEGYTLSAQCQFTVTVTP